MAHHQPIRKHAPGPGANPFAPAPGDGPVNIPDKLYFRIGEVARLCDVPAYVLRFWEGEFPQLKPNKGGTGQRLFRRRDVEMALRIKQLLYNEGYTIPGARQLLKSEARLKEPQLLLLGDDARFEAPRSLALHSLDRDSQLRRLRQELAGLLSLLRAAPKPASPDRSPTPALRSAARQPGSATASGRTTPISVPADDKLFDFPGAAAAPTDPQPALEDPYDE